MTQIRRDGVHARSATALGATGIDIQHRVPRLSLLTGLYVCCRWIVLDAMFAAKYVEIAKNNARDIRRPVCVPVFVLKIILKLNFVVTLFQYRYNIAIRRSSLSCYSSLYFH